MNYIARLMMVTLIAGAAMAQSGGVDSYTGPQLRQMTHKLEQQASFRSTGTAFETIEKYPGHYTMLAVRNRNGGAELHEHYADIFFVLDGEATLTTGGTVVDPKTIGPGETLGSAVAGGAQRKLAKGDVVHISAKTPHQLLIAKGQRLTYFVVKVKE